MITPKKEPNSIGDVVFKIDISQTEKVEGGFFAGTQLFFVIRIVSTEIHAKRKIQDFIWFRECLCKEFPVSYIPPLALVENRPNDVEYIENQMINLTSFLQDIINSSELRNSEFLDAFLMTSDYNQFLESKKQLDQTLPKRDFRSTVTRAKGIETSLELLDLERMQTRSKHIDLKISPLLKYFFKNYNTISEERRVAIGKLKDLSKDINEGLKHAERSYKEMAKICAQLHQSTVEFNQDNKNSENEIFEKTFSALQNAFLSIGESKAKESENAKKNLLDLFTNWERELISLDEIVKIRNTVGLDYVAMKTDLKEKKTKLLNAPGAKPEFDKLALKYCCLDKDSEEFNRQKLKFLLPEATKAAHKVAECFGFINSWVYDQVLVYSHARNEKTTELLQDFCKKEIDIIMMRQVAISELKTELEKYVDRNKQLTKFLPKL